MILRKNGCDMPSSVLVRASIVKVWRCRTAGQTVLPGRRTLLWRGVKRSTLATVLRKGVQIHKGCLYGSGVYFSKHVCKALQHARAHQCGNWGTHCRQPRLCVCKHRASPVTLLVCEVVLGRPYQPKGNPMSVGLGRYTIELAGATRAPKGYSSVSATGASDPFHTEFVVYDPARVLVKYVVEVHMETVGLH